MHTNSETASELWEWSQSSIWCTRQTPPNLQKQIKTGTQLQSAISRRLSPNSSGENVNGVYWVGNSIAWFFYLQYIEKVCKNSMWVYKGCENQPPCPGKIFMPKRHSLHLLT